MAGEPWSDLENDLIVADYFAMLDREIAKVPYNKTKRRRHLLPQLNNRSEKSVEYKHQNISAVLKWLGQDWIRGYKPAFNYQGSLASAVMRWLQKNPDWPSRHLEEIMPSVLRESALIWVGPSPTQANTPAPHGLEEMLTIARKYDVAGRDERNRILGEAGERHVLTHEKITLKHAGRVDLAQKVRWVSKEDGDGAGYDISSFTASGETRLIEVKTTNGWERTPFYISKNELDVSIERPSEWCLFRLYHFAREPKAFELYPPLETHVNLIELNYVARFD